MSEEMVAVLVIAGDWLAIGVVLSVVMGRRGHFGPGWGILGAMLGPFAVVTHGPARRVAGAQVVKGDRHRGHPRRGTAVDLIRYRYSWR